MIPVQIRFTRKIIEYIDRLIESGVYSNRSEAIRDATRRLVMDISPSENMNIRMHNIRKMFPENLKSDANGE